MMKMDSKEEIIRLLRKAVKEYDYEKCVELTKKAIEMGVNPIEIVEEGLTKELQAIGDAFGRGDLFITDLVGAASTVEGAMKVLQPVFEKNKEKIRSSGKVVIGTVEGDVHDIGKKIVASVLRANSFEVLDLGVDVPIPAFVEKVKEVKPEVVGASALLTTTLLKQRELIEALRKVGLRDKVKVIIGGAACSEEWAKKIGADAYGVDAMDAIVKVKSLVKELTEQSPMLNASSPRKI